VCVCVHAFVHVRGWASQDVSVIIKTLFMKEQQEGYFADMQDSSAICRVLSWKYTVQGAFVDIQGTFVNGTAKICRSWI